MTQIVTDEMMREQTARLEASMADLRFGIQACVAERNRLRAVLEELDGELDRQLYNDEYVRSMRNSNQDIAPDCEHHVIIRHELWCKISRALQPSS